MVDAAGQHEVAAARAQLGDAGVDRHQRRRAGGVDDVGGAAQVEAVGDPGGGQVGHHAHGGVGGSSPELVDEGVPHGVEPVGADLGQQRPQDRVTSWLAVRTRWTNCAPAGGQVAAPAEDDADPLGVDVEPGPAPASSRAAAAVASAMSWSGSVSVTVTRA